MAFIDNLLVLMIMAALILLVWSRVMNQKIIDSLREIREFITETREVNGLVDYQ